MKKTCPHIPETLESLSHGGSQNNKTITEKGVEPAEEDEKSLKAKAAGILQRLRASERAVSDGLKDTILYAIVQPSDSSSSSSCLELLTLYLIPPPPIVIERWITSRAHQHSKQMVYFCEYDSFAHSYLNPVG
jgi:hypothetical protein